MATQIILNMTIVHHMYNVSCWYHKHFYKEDNNKWSQWFM